MTTAAMEETESDAVSSTVCPVTAPVKLFSDPPADEKIVALWWRDRRYVLALSTMHNTSAYLVMEHPKGSQDKQSLPCPTAIIDYNQYMGGVDLMDQHLSYYSMNARRTLKWWKIFWRLVDISVVNSWIIFCCKTQNLM